MKGHRSSISNGKR